MVILIVVKIWFCTGVGACVLEAEMLVRKRKEARNTSQSVVIVIDIIKNLKSYIFWCRDQDHD